MWTASIADDSPESSSFTFSDNIKKKTLKTNKYQMSPAAIVISFSKIKWLYFEIETNRLFLDLIRKWAHIKREQRIHSSAYAVCQYILRSPPIL